MKSKGILDLPRHSIAHWECRGKGCNECGTGVIPLTENQARLMLRAIEEETHKLMNLMYNWTQFRGRMDRIRDCADAIHNINKYGVAGYEPDNES